MPSFWFTIDVRIVNLQNRHNFGRQVVSIFLVKVIAAIFYIFSSGRLKRERNFYQRGG